MADIIKLLLDGITDILDGTSGKTYAVNDDRFRRVKTISLITGIVTLGIALLALLIWLIGRIV